MNLTERKAIASTLAQFSFTLKTRKSTDSSAEKSGLPNIPQEEKIVPVEPTGTPLSDAAKKGWERGLIYAGSQNLAREVCILLCAGLRSAHSTKW
jgi:hypothetical protein